MKALHMLAMLLLLAGGINWGLVGLFQFDLVAEIFKTSELLQRVVYVAIGAAAVFKIVFWVRKKH